MQNLVISRSLPAKDGKEMFKKLKCSRAQLLFCSLNLLFSDVAVAVAVAAFGRHGFLKLPIITSGRMLWIKLFLDLLFTSDNLPCFLNDHQSLVKLECYIIRGLKTVEKPPTSSLIFFLPFFPSSPPTGMVSKPSKILRHNVLAKHLRCHINLPLLPSKEL